jgi:DNA-binding GntR family transcriptional regulator
MCSFKGRIDVEKHFADLMFETYGVEIENPRLEIQLVAVKQDGTAIQYIKDPCLEVQQEAINQNSDAIKYIKNQHKDLIVK